MSTTPGRLLLIPTPLYQPGEAQPWLLEADRQQVSQLTDFYVETPKVARRWLGQLGMARPIQELAIHPLPAPRDKGARDKGPRDRGPHDMGAPHRNPEAWLAPLLAGRDAGLLSDAGCPGVADPGALLVEAAHGRGIEVVPLVGPSSILLGLMASGLNGQQFAFHGYLPSQAEERTRSIARLAQRSKQQHETELLIETPYRNQAMAEALITHLPEEARLCIATDLTGAGQSIRTHTVREWRRQPPEMPDRKPALFLFLA